MEKKLNKTTAAAVADRAMTEETMQKLVQSLRDAINMFAEFAHTFTPADRKKLISAGIKNLGFIEASAQSAIVNPQFVPGTFNLTEYSEVVADVFRKRELLQLVRQLEQQVSDSLLESGDVAYHKSLYYYNTLKEAAKQKVSGAEAIYKALEPYFRKKKSEMDEPTRKQLERDIHSLLSGTKDGKIVITNQRPQTTGGVHEVVDETGSPHVAVKVGVDEEVK